MVYTAIDNNAVKVRIKLIIDSTTTLVDKDNPKKTLLREVTVGAPPNNEYKDLHHPALVITNSERWMEEQRRGPVIARAKTSVSTVVRYDLILTVHEEESRDAEKKVDNLFKLIEEQLYKFDNLQNPTGGVDPLCNSLILETTRRIPQFVGQEIDGFKATLAVEILPNDS